MQGHKDDLNQQQFLYNGLKEMLNPRNALYQLTDKIQWSDFEKELGQYYSVEGRPSKPIRLMVSLLILKQLYNKGDETVVEEWVQNPYWQYFSGEKEFQWKMPLEPSDFVHFRKRIGEKGAERIFKASIDVHGKSSQEASVVIDTTVQEKNITYPTDAKLQRKIVSQCVMIAKNEGIILRQSYKRTVKRLLLLQRFRRHSKNYKQALRAGRKLRTIAGRLSRELERKLPLAVLPKYSEKLSLFSRVLRQKKEDSNKIYSLHAPEVYCISKGKEHKKYEFGNKVSIALTKNSCIIVGAVSIPENKYDGDTLPETIAQRKRLIEKPLESAIVDRGYRGRKEIDGVKIITPDNGSKASAYEKRKKRFCFRRRAAIEPVIGHLKSDFGLNRNFLKGKIGDSINVMLAAAAFNFRKYLRKLRFIFCLFKYWLNCVTGIAYMPEISCI